jgi:type IV pilus assembly protein PilW
MTNKKMIAALSGGRERGLSLIELMIAITLGLLIVAALLALFLNITRTNNEMAKMNRQIENGRFAIQLLQEDVVHAGFWGNHVPQFDDLTAVTVPLDAPTALPDPCLANPATWTTEYKNNLIGIPLQANAGSCAVNNQQGNTDVLVVRHAQTCETTEANCEAEINGNLYFQSTLCEKEVMATAQNGTTSTITLEPGASPTDGFYIGAVIRIIDGIGVGQERKITGYSGGTKEATVDTPWAITPDNSSIYTFGLGYILDTTGHIFHNRDCATPAGKRKFVSNIYYIRDHSTPGDGIPTLVRSSFDLAGGALGHQSADALIEGIQGFRVEYGIDGLSDTGNPVDYSSNVVWANPDNKNSPSNRGDGIPDGNYVGAASVTCNSLTDCAAANIVSARIHVLARSLEPTPGYTDSKTYQLGNKADGTPFTMGPFNDNFKRHVFTTTVRLVNPSGRRETP